MESKWFEGNVFEPVRKTPNKGRPALERAIGKWSLGKEDASWEQRGRDKPLGACDTPGCQSLIRIRPGWVSPAPQTCRTAGRRRYKAGCGADKGAGKWLCTKRCDVALPLWIRSRSDKTDSRDSLWWRWDQFVGPDVCSYSVTSVTRDQAVLVC